MTDTVSLLGLVTKSALPFSVSESGERPTLIVSATASVERLTTDTVPVVAAPVDRSETIAVPSERLVVSPEVATRPPWFDTNALLPAITTSRGALPTGISLVSALVAVSITPSVLLPLIAT